MSSLWIAGAQIFIWSALALGVVLTGAPSLYRDLATNSFRPPGPYYSTDSFLGFSTSSAVSSENLLAQFAKIPPSQSVLILYKSTDPLSSLLAFIGAYLAWPHPVELLDLTAANAESELVPNQAKSISALVFCRVPAFIPSDRKFGDNLEIVSLLR